MEIEKRKKTSRLFILIGIIFIILGILTLIYPVQAITGTLGVDNPVISGSPNFASSADPFAGFTGGLVNSTYFPDINNYPHPSHIYCSAVIGHYSNDTVTSAQTGVDLYIGATKIGSGIFGFQFQNSTYLGGYGYSPTIAIYLNIDEWDVSGFTGAQNVTMVNPYDSNWYRFGLRNLTAGQRTGHNPLSDVSGMAGFNNAYYGYISPADGLPWTGYSYAGTYLYQFKNTYYAIQDAGNNIYVTVYKSVGNKSSIYIQSGNNYLGYENTINANNYYFSTSTAPIKICARDFFGYWYNTSDLFTANYTRTYTLSVTPESINYGDAFNMLIISDDGLYSGVVETRYGYTNKNTGDSDILYDGNNPSYLMDYAKISGIWYQYDTITSSFSINKGASIPNPVTTTGDSKGNILIGEYTIDGYLILSDNTVITLRDDLSILQNATLQELVIEAKDYLTGDLIGGTHVNVLDIAKNTWINQTSGLGTITLFYPYNTHLFIEVTRAPSYITAVKNWTVTSVPYYRLWIIMYRGKTPPTAYTTLYVSVFDGGNYAPLTGASVIVTDETGFSGEEQQKYTGGSGVATFNLSVNRTYTIRASKTGYLNGGDMIDTTGLGGTSIEKSILLQRSSLVSPISTATIPPITTATQIGGNITPSADCKITMPKGSTVLDVLFNNMACAGIKSGTNQGYAISIMIIFVLGIIGGKYGKGIGTMGGIGAGYVISLAMGLVPLWTFVAILVIFGIIMANKIFGKD